MMPSMQPDLARKIAALRGPILVLGASGSIGANLLRLLLEHRKDVCGATLTLPAARLEGIASENLWAGDVLVSENLDALLQRVQPATVFDCLSISVAEKARLAETLRSRNVPCYLDCCVHSSEALVDAALNLPAESHEDEGISAVIPCYTEAQTIPVMYERLVQIFEKLNIDYEIIFVDNGSRDNAAEVILDLSRKNPRVVGLSLSRNFGSQAAFRSGMEIATKRAVILLDGDLQDPPELIEQFVAKWREGYDVVYGRRVKREATLVMQAAYKLFYLLLNRMSYVYMPRDAGDFSLMDRKVVRWILECKERDLFIRGLRAFVGFRQVGVDYHRPDRLFGKSNLNFLNNLGWAKKGILSFSNVPLTMLTTAGVILFMASMGIGFLHVLAKLMFPEIAPQGITTVVVLILGLGSLNLLAISIVGEYIAKIFEEVKGRPPYIRMSIIQNGEIRPASGQYPR